MSHYTRNSLVIIKTISLSEMTEIGACDRRQNKSARGFACQSDFLTYFYINTEEGIQNPRSEMKSNWHIWHELQKKNPLYSLYKSNIYIYISHYTSAIIIISRQSKSSIRTSNWHKVHNKSMTFTSIRTAQIQNKKHAYGTYRKAKSKSFFTALKEHSGNNNHFISVEMCWLKAVRRRSGSKKTLKV